MENGILHLDVHAHWILKPNCTAKFNFRKCFSCFVVIRIITRMIFAEVHRSIFRRCEWGNWMKLLVGSCHTVRQNPAQLANIATFENL